MPVYGFDTETDNDGQNEAWVVQWALVRATGKRNVWTGRSVSEFCSILLSLFEKGGSHDYIYIANINYDWYFIMDGVAAMCAEHRIAITPVLRNGRIISVDLEPTEDSDLDNHRITFRDTMAKIPGSSVQSLGKMIGLPKLEGVSDFHIGWSHEVDLDDPARWEYVIRDAEIVAKAMHMMHQSGRKKGTASGDAWQAMKKYVAQDKDYKDNWKWEHLFPKLSTEYDLRLRRSYCGGLNISMYRGRHAVGEDVEAITHEDVHSMYPTVMSYDPLPYGVPNISLTCPREGALYIAEVRIKLQLKEGMFPWFQFKNAVDYVMEGLPFGTAIEACYHWHEISLTNVDLDILSDWYDIEYDPDYQVIYHIFLQKTGVFEGYIKKFMAIKEASEKGSLEYTSAKLSMNSGYGRMALNREKVITDVVPETILGDEGSETVYRFKCHTELNDDTENYLPFAIFVTSWARARLLENVRQCLQEDKLVYHCDTDSVIHSGMESPELDHGDHLGGWGIENRPMVLYEGGFKRYIEILNHDYLKYPEDPAIKPLKSFSMACAGVPQRVNHLGVPIGMWVELLDDPGLITSGAELGREDYRISSPWLRKLYIDNGMDPDRVNTLKLIGRRVHGGVILDGHTHTLNDGMQIRMRRLF